MEVISGVGRQVMPGGAEDSTRKAVSTSRLPAAPRWSLFLAVLDFLLSVFKRRHLLGVDLAIDDHRRLLLCRAWRRAPAPDLSIRG